MGKPTGREQSQEDGSQDWGAELLVSMPPVERACACGLTAYKADLDEPLYGAPLRVGEVWHMEQSSMPGDFEKATLSLHANGLHVEPAQEPEAAGTKRRQPISLALSPFALVQACRFDSSRADAAMTWLRLFKVSFFQHGLTHFFATCGSSADTQRARWVADISRAIRAITLSLLPLAPLQTQPLGGLPWTATRLLATYALHCSLGVATLVFCELHAHRDGCTTFVVYADDTCLDALLHLTLTMGTVISERVGVDCGCFSIDMHHFAVRTCALKKLWLRAISNLKVKMRHCVTNPSSTDLMHFRQAVRERALTCREDPGMPASPMLPLWKASRADCPVCSGLEEGAAKASAEAPDADRGAGPTEWEQQSLQKSGRGELSCRGLSRERIEALPESEKPFGTPPIIRAQPVLWRKDWSGPRKGPHSLHAPWLRLPGPWMECKCEEPVVGNIGAAVGRLRGLCPKGEEEAHGEVLKLSEPVLPDRLVRIYDDVEAFSWKLAGNEEVDGRPARKNSSNLLSPWPSPRTPSGEAPRHLLPL